MRIEANKCHALGAVTICKWKRPVGSGAWSGYVLAPDVAGTWVFTPAQSTYTGHDGLRYGSCEVGQDPPGNGRDSLVLLPDDRWFVAHFVHGSELLVHVDIATPPRLDGGIWTYDDLELDPYLTEAGDFGVDDRDEFDQACSVGLIDAEERRAAELTVAWLSDAVGGAEAPLVRFGRVRLQKALALPLPPVRACALASAGPR